MPELVTPEEFVGDAWMNDPVRRKAFEDELDRLDLLFEPITNALEASTRLTEKDYAITINPVD